MVSAVLATTALTIAALATPGDAVPSTVSGSAVPPSGAATAAATAPSALPLPDPILLRQILQRVGELSGEQRRLRAQTRDQMLAELSPAHRALVATLVGELAVAPNPDRAATAQRLTATLSPPEQRAILASNARALAQSQSIGQQMQSLFVSLLTPEQRSEMQRQFAQAKADLEKRFTPEQRAAMGRQAVQLQALAPPLATTAGGLPFSLAGTEQDAGSVLLRTLTTPDGPVMQFSQGSHLVGSPQPNAMIESKP